MSQHPFLIFFCGVASGVALLSALCQYLNSVPVMDEPVLNSYILEIKVSK